VPPAAQVPAASQRPARVCVDPAQLSAAQAVPAGYGRQAPFPSQRPSAPQPATGVARQVPRGSAAPAAAFLHTPIELVSAHERQAPAQASLQQTPSTQKPLAHSAEAAQVCPRPLGPQLAAAVSQVWPAAQSASLPQLALQRPSLHP
jgi:hypothetical protein